MINFCTLFDSAYLSRGLALFESLEAKMEQDFRLYVLAMDDYTYRFLNRLCISNLIPVALETIEDRQMKSIKPMRSRGEYCWTCTSCFVHFLLDTFNLPQVIYCDADIYFFGSPEPVLADGWDASVMMTPHFYSPEYDKSRSLGKYNVQFLPFKNDNWGKKTASWWKDACIDWCYDRIEENRFGDQKYLDEWEERFDRVRVIDNRGVGVAPWNCQQYEFFEHEKTLRGIQKSNSNTFDVIFYHFHGFKLIEGGRIDCGLYQLSSNTIDEIYRPYVLHQQKILNAHPQLRPFAESVAKKPMENIVERLKRQYRGIHNVYPAEDFSNG
ncbi:MAG: glycosyl transferase [Legionellales bacterium]|nr:glycosyl transferase [Legionellales bacterium]